MNWITKIVIITTLLFAARFGLAAEKPLTVENNNQQFVNSCDIADLGEGVNILDLNNGQRIVMGVPLTVAKDSNGKTIVVELVPSSIFPKKAKPIRLFPGLRRSFDQQIKPVAPFDQPSLIPNVSSVFSAQIFPPWWLSILGQRGGFDTPPAPPSGDKKVRSWLAWGMHIDLIIDIVEFRWGQATLTKGFFNEKNTGSAVRNPNFDMHGFIDNLAKNFRKGDSGISYWGDLPELGMSLIAIRLPDGVPPPPIIPLSELRLEDLPDNLKMLYLQGKAGNIFYKPAHKIAQTEVKVVDVPRKRKPCRAAAQWPLEDSFGQGQRFYHFDKQEQPAVAVEGSPVIACINGKPLIVGFNRTWLSRAMSKVNKYSFRSTNKPNEYQVTVNFTEYGVDKKETFLIRDIRTNFFRNVRNTVDEIVKERYKDLGLRNGGVFWQANEIPNIIIRNFARLAKDLKKNKPSGK